MTRSGASLRVEDAADAAVIILKVSGKDVLLKQDFKRAPTVVLPTRDAEGKPLPDGLYHYEVTVFPTAPRAGSSQATGSYRIRFGAVEPTSPPLTSKIGTDVAYNENLYVTGRACIGPGCSPTETFNDEDLQITSAFPWLLFDDLNISTTPYPYHDWQLMIGDDHMNGIERFSIQDVTADTIPFTIEGGAPDSALYVTKDGKVGMGTSIPEAALDIDGPDIHLNYPPYWEWRLRGGTEFTITNEGYYATGAVPLRIGEVAPTNSLVLHNTGAVGMGTATPSERLHVFQNENANALVAIENPNVGTAAAAVLRAKSNTATVNFQAHGSGRSIMRFNTALASWNEFLSVAGNGLAIGTLGAAPIVLGTNNVNRINILANGLVGIGTASPGHPLQMASGAHVTAGGVWTNASSRALKTNIHEISAEDASATLRALQPVTFEYSAERGESYAGFIAEDVPELVAMNDRESLSAMDIVAVLTRVTQKQSEQLESQQKTIEELAAELRAIKEQLRKQQ